MSHYVLDARTATPHFPGIGRYVSNLAAALVPLLGPDERLTVVEQPGHPLKLPEHPAVRAVSVAPSPFSLRQQWALPQLLRDLGADLYHSPYYLMPYRLWLPAIVTIYDLIPLRYPEHSSLRARVLFRHLTALALQVSAHVIVGSVATRDDVSTCFPSATEKITAIPMAADPRFAPQYEAAVQALRQRYRLPDPFVLYVGSNKPHKNLVRLVEDWAMIAPAFPDTRLVIAGPWSSAYPEPRNRAVELGLTEQSIRWLGPLPEEDLAALYGAARLFVFPSLYEGFGLPVIEAMACGAPVACSRGSSLSEVAGDAAVLFSPELSGAIAEAITGILKDEALRDRLCRRGLARAKEFSWERTARETLSLYREAVSSRESSLAE